MQATAQQTQELYGRNLRAWGRHLGTVSRRIRRQLERERIKYTLKHRIKTVESLLEKQAQRAARATGSTEPIADLLGLRITVPFLEDVETIVGAIREAFTVHEIERKGEQLSYREFAYDSVHIIVVDPAAAIEYPAGCLASSCEIQVRTTLQDAWAEVEHELIYKGAVTSPDATIKKKLAALNASLTLSDIVFQEIRDRQQELRRWGSERFHELEKKAAFGSNRVFEPLGLGPVADWAVPADYVGDKSERLEAAVRKAFQAHRAGKYASAIRCYDDALEQYPEVPSKAAIYNGRGLAYFMLRKERAALRDFERSVRCDAGYYPGMTNCALIWRRFGHLDRSLEEFERSLAVESRQPEVLYLRAQTLIEAGRAADALASVRRALELDAGYEDAIRLRRELEATE